MAERALDFSFPTSSGLVKSTSGASVDSTIIGFTKSLVVTGFCGSLFNTGNSFLISSFLKTTSVRWNTGSDGKGSITGLSVNELNKTGKSAIPVMLIGFDFLKKSESVIHSAAIIGVIAFALAIYAVLTIQETHNTDLDFTE